MGCFGKVWIYNIRKNGDTTASMVHYWQLLRYNTNMGYKENMIKHPQWSLLLGYWKLCVYKYIIYNISYIICVRMRTIRGLKQSKSKHSMFQTLFWHILNHNLGKLFWVVKPPWSNKPVETATVSGDTGLNSHDVIVTIPVFFFTLWYIPSGKL